MAVPDMPDAVQLVVNYLTSLVDPVAVASRIPPVAAIRPPLVTVRRIGGTATLPVRDTARLDIFAWHRTDPEAMALALTVRAAVWKLAGTTMPGGVQVYRVSEFMGPQQADDSDSGTPRVWTTYELDLRADALISPAPRQLN